MRKSKGSKYYGSNISFIDMLFNINMLFFLLLIIAIIQINPKAKQNDVESKAEMMVVMNWPDNNPNDVDLWIKTPEGQHIGFSNRENSYIHLERDDRGAVNNNFMKNGEKVELPFRREVLVFRGKADGRYVVNVHLYAIKDLTGSSTREKNIDPIPVSVELIQVNPTYEILVKKELTLSHLSEEKTSFSFIIKEGKVVEIDKDVDEPFLTETPITTYSGTGQR